MLRRFFLFLSRSKRMQRFVMSSRLTRRLVQRFIAGNSLDEAVVSGRRLLDQGILLTMDHVGESVSTEAEADAAAQEYHVMLDRIHAERLDSTISIKPSQMGLVLDPAACGKRLEALVRKSTDLGLSVEIDMEDSPYTQVTLDMYFGFLPLNRKLRVCLQSCLHRSVDDERRIIELGGSIRLVKGAYREPPEVAYQRKSQVDAKYAEMIDVGLTPAAASKGFYLAIASHDEKLVTHGREVAARNGLNKDQLEFQFLYGIRTDLQLALARAGYRVRVYLPYGREWYPYFMRRLAERPANVLFLVKQLFR
ncbi:MAG: proline dehydrogenase [Deltaproteobacteria bacterium]|nr:proline dehydrogenase [Deltaproteobacteria bacterium]